MRTSRTGRHRAAGGCERGFTLVELLVVLALIALFATLAAPLMRGALPGVEIEAAAEELGGELRLLRSQAISRNRESWMLVDVGIRSYSGGSGRPHALPAGTDLELLTGASEIVDAGRGRIRFYPDGTSTGGSVRLHRDGQAYEVRVDWFNGAVEIRAIDAE